MLCDNCGKILPDNAQMCDGCGKPTGRREDPQNVSQPPMAGPPPLPGAPQGQYAPPPPPPPPHQPYAAPNSYMDNPYQRQYAQPGHQGNPPAVTVGQWMLMDLILMIPLVNIIMLFVWAFGDTNPNRRNKARANLLWFAIAIGFMIMVAILGGLAGMGASRYQ